MLVPAVLLLLFVAGCSTAPTDAHLKALVGATLVDGSGQAPLPDSVVIIEGERITCAGRSADCPLPADIARVDVSSRWLVPGLINTHVHLGWTHDRDKVDRDQAIRLAYGITTVREGGTYGELDNNLAARETAAAARKPVPRLVVSGQVSRGIADAEGIEPVALARRLLEQPIDSMKVKHGLTMTELTEIFRLAHGAGLPVWGHTWEGPRPPRSHTGPAVEAGIDGIAHLFGFPPATLAEDARPGPAPPKGNLENVWAWERGLWRLTDHAKLEALAELMIAHDVWLEPLLATEMVFFHSYQLSAEEEELIAIPSIATESEWMLKAPRPAPLQEQLDAAYRRILWFVRHFHERGGRIITGTDDEPLPGIGLHEEIALLVESGLSPVEALLAATRESAIALARDDEIGRIAPGYLADMVLLEQDPLANIRNLRRIHRVIKGGIFHDPAEILAKVKTWE